MLEEVSQKEIGISWKINTKERDQLMKMDALEKQGIDSKQDCGVHLMENTRYFLRKVEQRFREWLSLWG